MIINQISAGVKLPDLSNPATAENIESGYEVINANGEVVTGTAEIPSYTVEYGYLAGNIFAESRTIYTTNPRKSKTKVYAEGFSNRQVWCRYTPDAYFYHHEDASDWSNTTLTIAEDSIVFGIVYSGTTTTTGSGKTIDLRFHYVVIDED